MAQTENHKRNSHLRGATQFPIPFYECVCMNVYGRQKSQHKDVTCFSWHFFSWAIILIASAYHWKHEAHSSQGLAVGQWILDFAFLDISSSSTPTKFRRHVDYIDSVGRRRKEEGGSNSDKIYIETLTWQVGKKNREFPVVFSCLLEFWWFFQSVCFFGESVFDYVTMCLFVVFF